MIVEYRLHRISENEGFIYTSSSSMIKTEIIYKPLQRKYEGKLTVNSLGRYLLIPNLSPDLSPKLKIEREFQRYILENREHPMNEYNLVRYVKEQIRVRFIPNVSVYSCGSFPDGANVRETCEIKYSEKETDDIMILLTRNNFQVCRHAQGSFSKTCLLYLFDKETINNGYMDYYEIRIVEGGEVLEVNECLGTTNRGKRCRNRGPYCYLH